MNIIKTKEIKVGEIRYNNRHGHFGHVKAIIGTKNGEIVYCVFLSSKDKDGKRNNAMLSVPLKINNIEHSYFITRIRSYPSSTYSSMAIIDGLTEEDLKLSDTIYEMYLERKKIGTVRNGNRANQLL